MCDMTRLHVRCLQRLVHVRDIFLGATWLKHMQECVAVCVAVCCSLLCVAVCCRLSQRVTVLQCVAVWCSSAVQYGVVWRNVLQCVAVCCSALQCVAVNCSAVQCDAVFVAVCCSVL